MDDEMNFEDETVKSGENRAKPSDAAQGKPPTAYQFGNRQKTEEEWAKTKETKARNKQIREMIKACLTAKFILPPAIKQKMIELWGEDVVNKNVIELGTLQQINKMILKQDTNAFNSLVSTTIGPTKTEIELSGPDGEALFEGKSDDDLKKLADEIATKVNDK